MEKEAKKLRDILDAGKETGEIIDVLTEDAVNFYQAMSADFIVSDGMLHRQVVVLLNMIEKMPLRHERDSFEELVISQLKSIFENQRQRAGLYFIEGGKGEEDAKTHAERG